MILHWFKKPWSSDSYATLAPDSGRALRALEGVIALFEPRQKEIPVPEQHIVAVCIEEHLDALPAQVHEIMRNTSNDIATETL